MKKIVLTMMVVLFCSAGAVQAGLGSKVPFVRISVISNKLNLGTMPFAAGFFDSPGTLTVEVESNCLHGPIMASITHLKHSAGYWIKANRIYINTPATGGFVSMAKPVVISDPTEGSHSIKMNFKIDNKFENRLAGRYTGSIMFTVIPLVKP